MEPTNVMKRKLPPGWRWAKLGEVCDVIGGSTPSTGNSDYWDGDIVWVTPTDLGKLDGQVIRGSSRRITSAGYQSCGTEILSSGTVVMSSRAPIGHLGIAGVPLCTNQGCKSFVPGPDVDSVFLYWSVKWVVPNLQILGSGATFAEVSKSQLQQFQILLPPLSEQKRIAAILSEQMVAVERARAAAQAQLDAARTLPVAYLREVFPRPGQALLSGWRWARLGEVCDISARQVDPKLPEFSGLPHVSAEDIESGTGRLFDLRSAAEDGMISGKYLFESGCVLYSKIRPYLRKVAIAPFRGLCSADMYPLDVANDSMDSHFLLWVLLSQPFTEFADSESRRARMPKLNRSQLFSYLAPLPPLLEQKQIAARIGEKIAAAERLQAELAAQLDEINVLPVSLLRRAFRGEI